MAALQFLQRANNIGKVVISSSSRLLPLKSRLIFFNFQPRV